MSACFQVISIIVIIGTTQYSFSQTPAKWSNISENNLPRSTQIDTPYIIPFSKKSLPQGLPTKLYPQYGDMRNGHQQIEKALFQFEEKLNEWKKLGDSSPQKIMAIENSKNILNIMRVNMKSIRNLTHDNMETVVDGFRINGEKDISNVGSNSKMGNQIEYEILQSQSALIHRQVTTALTVIKQMQGMLGKLSERASIALNVEKTSETYKDSILMQQEIMKFIESVEITDCIWKSSIRARIEFIGEELARTSSVIQETNSEPLAGNSEPLAGKENLEYCRTLFSSFQLYLNNTIDQHE